MEGRIRTARVGGVDTCYNCIKHLRAAKALYRWNGTACDLVEECPEISPRIRIVTTDRHWALICRSTVDD